MATMGRRSLTKKAWKAQRSFTSEVQFLKRKTKRLIKGWNARKLREQARSEIGREKQGG
jgi:hypothetical protein